MKFRGEFRPKIRWRSCTGMVLSLIFCGLVFVCKLIFVCSCGDGIILEWNTTDLRKVDPAAKNINTYIETTNPNLPPFSAKKVLI